MRCMFLLLGCLFIATGAIQAQDTLKVKNGIVIPKKTEAERNAISSPETGLMVFDPVEKRFFFYEGTVWKRLHPNTLDGAYDEGLNGGDGRVINADKDAVEIKATSSIGLFIVPSDTTVGVWVDSAKGGDTHPAFYTFALAGADGFEADVKDAGSGLEIRHEGDGDGGEIYHEGTGSGLYISHEGDGDGANFYKYPAKTGNSLTVYHEGTDTAVWFYMTGDDAGLIVSQLGNGVAGQFASGPGSDTTTLEVINAGGGKGLEINMIPAADSAGIGLEVIGEGSMPGIVLVQEADGNGIEVNSVDGTGGIFTRFMAGMPPTELLKAELATAGGSAAYFEKTGDGAAAVEIKNIGSGPALTIANTNLLDDVVILDNVDAGSFGTLLKATTFGNGTAAEFNIDKATNGTDCVIGTTKGIGSAGVFRIVNPLNTAGALVGLSDGGGAGVEAGNDGTGNALLATKGVGSFFGHAAEFVSMDTLAVQAVRIEGTSSIDEVCNIVHKTGGDALRVDGKTDLNGFTTVAGDLFVTGVITGASKSFKIDHPLDPENKFLYHVSIESDELLNIYTGNITLDESGEAVVELPEWFEALNKDFRYNLTCIGGFAQVYIATEVEGNQFKIGGGKKGLKVSWQVSGVRKDKHAISRNFKAEVNKPSKNN